MLAKELIAKEATVHRALDGTVLETFESYGKNKVF
jgi:hypothetical protein